VTQLAAKELFQRAILAQGVRRSVCRCVEADQLGMGFFAERIGRDGLMRDRQRVSQFTRLLQKPGELSESGQMAVGQPNPLRQDPLLVVAGQQLAAIEGESTAQPLDPVLGIAFSLRLLKGRFKGHDIGCNDLTVELNAPVIGEKDGPAWDAGRFELATQGRKFHPQVQSPGRRLGLGPEHRGQLLTRVGTAAVEGEVSEKNACLMGAEPGDRPILSPDLQPAK